MPESGVPESFMVLIKELQNPCLNVKVLSEGDREIEIKEVEEDVIETAKEAGIDILEAENPEDYGEEKDGEFDGKFMNEDFELDIKEEETDN